MKLRDLLRRIGEEGAVLVRHGSNHDWYRNVITGIMEAVPRHRARWSRSNRQAARQGRHGMLRRKESRSAMP